MSVQLFVPKEYGYVILTTIGTCFLGFWHAGRVANFRRKAKVPYPKAFADSGDLSSASSGEQKKAMYIFNCAQRAHANYLENHGMTMAAMLIAGVQHPLWATGLGLVWAANRIAYAIGYTRADKTDGSGRYAGIAFSLPQVGLCGLAAWVGLKMVM
ncbi:hypothetical protein BAUCODRAFT_65848 [Baudoinia panamericana UAMH 10762]|uniref:Membrane-associated proteins in eicosanoid and glutathione metabolism n=1 Tax=Baudoinia panamericana (strain UAMH 10762) TaxID=717646 RepID=M2MPG6_BAUPA|nr:uncharacterized protein BAUCODRAFT_65848 [Baudoinia panamericana UAMH 10762]EMC98631.1 hypothetical protein BAUCODRAFT_65848 [Baudoinia panamericana UAMH 10762]